MTFNEKLIDVMRQCRDEHEVRIRSRIGKTSTVESGSGPIGDQIVSDVIQANVAGFDSGWREAVSYLKLHGYIKGYGHD